MSWRQNCSIIGQENEHKTIPFTPFSKGFFFAFFLRPINRGPSGAFGYDAQSFDAGVLRELRRERWEIISLCAKNYDYYFPMPVSDGQICFCQY